MTSWSWGSRVYFCPNLPDWVLLGPTLPEHWNSHQVDDLQHWSGNLASNVGKWCGCQRESLETALLGWILCVFTKVLELWRPDTGFGSCSTSVAPESKFSSPTVTWTCDLLGSPVIGWGHVTCSPQWTDRMELACVRPSRGYFPLSRWWWPHCQVRVRSTWVPEWFQRAGLLVNFGHIAWARNKFFFVLTHWDVGVTYHCDITQYILTDIKKSTGILLLPSVSTRCND